jgi:hypothetical protein
VNIREGVDDASVDRENFEFKETKEELATKLNQNGVK